MEAALHNLLTTQPYCTTSLLLWFWWRYQVQDFFQDPNMSNQRTTLLCGHEEGPINVMWPSQANQSSSLRLSTWSWRKYSLLSMVMELKGPSRASRCHMYCQIEKVHLLQESVTLSRKKKLKWDRQSQTIPVASSFSCLRTTLITSVYSWSYPLFYEPIKS